MTATSSDAVDPSAPEAPRPERPSGTPARVTLLSHDPAPVLEVVERNGRRHRVPFEQVGRGRDPLEHRYLVEFEPPAARWRFRIVSSNRTPTATDAHPFFSTSLRELWLQDGQLFPYPPAPRVTPSTVIKHPSFRGSLPARALYVYLPRGYAQQPHRRYPLIVMHDGQNVFQRFAADSYAGSWRADLVADALIARGRMREAIIVGVANGGRERMLEYLPPYALASASGGLPSTVLRTRAHALPSTLPGSVTQRRRSSHKRYRHGRANRTARYYRDEILPYLHEHYRLLEGRDQVATVGSSMGGLLSTYLAWEHPELARHHAAMSPSYWLTKRPDGKLETVERLRHGRPRDIRLWLDSGTQDSPGVGDDNRYDAAAARDALLANGYRLGPDFAYYLDEGASHHENAWSARLDRVFGFLFPLGAPAEAFEQVGAAPAGERAGAREDHDG